MRMQTNETTYFFDSILNKSVYGVVPKAEEVESMEKIAKMFKELSEDSREYLMVRLEMLRGEC